MSQNLIETMASTFAFGVGAGSGQSQNEEKIVCSWLKAHTKHLSRRVSRVIRLFDPDNKAFVLFDDFLRFSQSPSLFESVQRNPKDVELFSALLLRLGCWAIDFAFSPVFFRQLKDTRSEQEVRFLQALVDDMKGPSQLLGAVFHAYTREFLRPAAERATKMLQESNFELLSKIPGHGSFEKRKNDGAFGKLIHLTLLDANVMRF